MILSTALLPFVTKASPVADLVLLQKLCRKLRLFAKK
jgi:hypothetical protein